MAILRGPRRSPAQQVQWDERDRGVQRSFRREAEAEWNGLCPDIVVSSERDFGICLQAYQSGRPEGGRSLLPMRFQAQKRWLPMILIRGRDHIQPLVAVLGLK